MSVLIVGSLGYDTISSPEGSVTGTLGGSATYGSLACQFHLDRLSQGSCSIVGVVGSDFRQADIDLFTHRHINIEGMDVQDGDTFRWTGAYEGAMSEATTLETHLNVFEHFEPHVPSHLQSPVVTFCANLHPEIQRSVLTQSHPQRLTMLDSMNLWIQIAQDSLLDIMRQVDVVIINDGEVKMLMQTSNVIAAMHELASQLSIPTLIIKRGEHGVVALHHGQMIALPAYPTMLLVDPTGCGDSFAGTLAACLSAKTGSVGTNELRTALMHATVTASFTLEAFGCSSLLHLERGVYDARFEAYSNLLGYN